VDLNNLATAWPASTGPALIGTTTTVTASNTAPTVNVSDNFTIAVTSNTGITVPTGTVAITVDGGTAITQTLSANGTYVYTTSFSTAGSHQVVAAYSGDTTHAASTGVSTVNVAGISTGTGSISLAATNVTVPQGSQANSTITVTPANGYQGTVELTFDTSNDNALQNLCYEFTNMASNGDGTVVITGTAAVATQLTLDTNAADCATALVKPGGKQPFHNLHRANTSQNKTPNPVPATLALAGLLLAGFFSRSSRKLRYLLPLLALAAVGLAITACGNNISNNFTDPPKGTYTVTVTGQDATTATINATTTFTLTIQ
jgi:hypothetical protein